ncbi:hypothetical protein Gotur_005851, partial [Gossypium turneri]
GLLGFHDIISATDQEFFEWLTRVFNGCSAPRRRVLCVALWRLWIERNKKLHGRVRDEQVFFHSNPTYQ